MSYYYPGNDAEFYSEFGGLPRKGPAIVNIFLIALVIIIIIIIVLAIGLLIARTTPTFIDHQGFFNLDNLRDLNNANTDCCVFAGDVAPNELYIYDTTTNITYSREPPFDINTTCNTFPNPALCVQNNTDSDGNIIPVTTFKAKPYYTFENGLFVICDSTTSCD